MVPNASTVAAAHACADASDEMSVCTSRTSPRPSSCPIAHSARSVSISATTTFAPSARNRSA